MKLISLLQTVPEISKTKPNMSRTLNWGQS